MLRSPSIATVYIAHRIGNSKSRRPNGPGVSKPWGAHLLVLALHRSSLQPVAMYVPILPHNVAGSKKVARSLFEGPDAPDRVLRISHRSRGGPTAKIFPVRIEQHLNPFGILEVFSFGDFPACAYVCALSEQLFHPADQDPEPHAVLEPALPTLADESDDFVERERGEVEDFLWLGRAVAMAMATFGFTERHA